MPPLCVNFIITIFLFIVSSPTLHGTDDENYMTCHEKTYDCGEQIKEIGYPFWGEGRPPFCGVQGFNLTCKGSENTTIVIEKQEFRVLYIDQSAYSMTIARADLWDTICPAEFINTALNFSPFDYDPHHAVNISLFYDCLPEIASYDHIYNKSHFECPKVAGSQSSSNISFFLKEPYVVYIPERECKSKIEVPVLPEALDAFWGNNPMTVEELVKQGFGADYHKIDKLQHCKACKDSGGECGTDTTTNQAICFCHDGHQSQMCPRPVPGPGSGPVPVPDVRQPPKNFRKSFYFGKDLKKLLDLPLEKRKAPLLLNFIPNYTSKLADVPRQRKKRASPPTASSDQVASSSEPADQPSTSAPKKRQRKLVKAAEMAKQQKKVLNLLADLPDDMEEEPAQTTSQPKPKRVKKAQPKAKVAEVDAEDEDVVPISKLTKKTTSAPAKRPAEVQPTGATQQKKQKSAAGTSSGSRGPKIPWEPKITLEDRPVYRNESAADPQIGVALSTAVLLDGDMEKNEKMGGYENYARMLQHSVQAIQHAHSFSMLAFETGKRLEDTEKELADLKRSQKKDQLRMKKLEDQAAEATKAKQIADEKAEATEALRTVAVAQQKEAEEKAAQAQKELQEGLATKEADLNAFYNKGMEDVAADYELQVKQACNHGFILGYNALAKKLNLPADSPWRKTESLRLPCPLPPSPSQAEVESESEAEAEDETLVRKARSPTKIDLTRDEEVEAAPKKTDFGTLTSDLLLIGRSVEETVAEIDAEVAADKVAEVATDKPAEVSQNKEAEVVVEGQTKVVAEESAEVVPEGPSEVSTQPTPEAEAA